MDSSPASAQLRDFSAHAIVDREISYTIVGGHFVPTAGIDLACQGVTLSVAGANDFRLVLPADSFSRTGLGGYVASVYRNSSKADILLQPFSGGSWAYSAGIQRFSPGSKPVTVSLTIGNQEGRATVEVYVF